MRTTFALKNLHPEKEKYLKRRHDKKRSHEKENNLETMSYCNGQGIHASHFHFSLFKIIVNCIVHLTKHILNLVIVTIKIIFIEKAH